MTTDTIAQLPDPHGFSADPLTELLRSGAQHLIQQAAEAELSVLLEAHATDTTDDGRARLVRHGHLPEPQHPMGNPGRAHGGKLIWASAFVTSAMRAQSHNALGQAGLLIGRPHLLRLDAPEVANRIGMDNVDRALAEMPPVARSLVEASGQRISQIFLQDEQRVPPQAQRIEPRLQTH